MSTEHTYLLVECDYVKHMICTHMHNEILSITHVTDFEQVQTVQLICYFYTYFFERFEWDFDVKELQHLTVEEFLDTRFDDEVAGAFYKNKISAEIFLLMTETSIVPAIGDVIKLRQLQASCSSVYSSPVPSSHQQLDLT